MNEFKKWLKCAGIRAIKTMAETCLAMIPVGITVQEVDWLTVLGTATLSGIISLLINIKGLPEMEE